MRRARYQFGAVYLVNRRREPDVWVFRYREGGRRRAETIGTVEQFPTRSAALKAAEGLRLAANPDTTPVKTTFGAVVDRYLREELPARKTTSTFYKPWIKQYIRPRWGDVEISEVKSYGVEVWLTTLPLGRKSKQHIRSLMKIMFDCAMRWEIIGCGRNPMSLVRIKNPNPKIARVRYRLTAKQVAAVLAKLTQPYRTMAIVAVCLGLRAGEVAGLQWGDFDWLDQSVLVQRGFVLGDENDVKTVGSKKRMPLAPALQEALLQHRRRWEIPGKPWVFVNPDTGVPYSMTHAQSNRLEPAGRAAGIGEGLGWHSFRHTYSTMLRALRVDVKVQQELLRHADIRTTMNIYTEAVSESLREANTQVARLLLQ